MNGDIGLDKANAKHPTHMRLCPHHLISFWTQMMKLRFCSSSWLLEMYLLTLMI